ncbi:MAG: glycosyl transferase, partial [Methylotenera sp.]|nr:glycosyl transferase [Methylotenera sp.]
MNPLLRYALGHRHPSPPWDDSIPIREELFGIERLEQHAQSLALAQVVTLKPIVVMSLQIRLNDNANVLLAAYHAGAAELEHGRPVVHAAEWLLDNYHLVEEQIREIREDLPPGYYRQLPKLASGPFAGYPRVFGLAWAFVAHTDSHFDPDTLRRFIAAYQTIQPLTIGELWAIAITLRIVLIENLRRLADQITLGRAQRAEAETFAASLLESGHPRAAFDIDIATRSSGYLSELFVAHLAKLLRDKDPRTMPALAWLEERLRLQGVTVDEMVQNSQQHQGASNVSIRNVIKSMRLISDIDWAELFESVSLIDKTLSAASQYGDMDFPTRNLYRSAIEQLARGSILPELEIASMVLETSILTSAKAITPAEKERFSDPGYHLIAEGRSAFEKLIKFRPTPRLWISRFHMRLGIGGYVGAILLVTTLLLGLGFELLDIKDLEIHWYFISFLVGFIPASQLAIALVDRAITWGFPATPLAGLELAAGIPKTLKTLVAVPTILTTEAELLENIERLEVHYLSGASGHIYFALLADGADADEEHTARDTQLLNIAFDAIAKLNIKYQSDPIPDSMDGKLHDRFLFLHRRRVFNAGEGKWIGWERKRGKLHELNRLLRGASDTTFSPIADNLRETHLTHLNENRADLNQVPMGIRYVITLDADTRLPRDAATKLIGKMAHPLNQPTFCEREKRIIRGYGILQPRVTPSLPIGREGSFYQSVFSAPGGMDPYAAAISDVYQDLFGEGSYTGKGIYDVDAFEAALAGRIPENTMLSHDLFEGVFVRAGLASDIEVVEESPSRYDVAVKREHRWARGDWQLLPWIFSKGIQSIPLVGQWKMIDNLRRSLVAPFNLLVLVLCWQLPTQAAIHATLLVIFFMVAPAFLPAVWSLLPRRSGFRLSNHFSTLASILRQASYQSFLTLSLLPDQATRMADAILRTWWRLLVTRRHLLEWTTAAKTKDRPRLSLYGFYQEMAGSSTLTLLITGALLVFKPASWPVVLPFAWLWLAAPAIAYCISRSPASASHFVVSAKDARYLRFIARRTWRYFETFVTPFDNMLPPDNFQEAPKSAIAHRTSPTNIGLYLLSTIAARDFGWVGTGEAIKRLEQTFTTMHKLERFKGHFFNWYDTKDLRTLDPPYVSAVDSGNLAGHLIVIANACDEWVSDLVGANINRGTHDTFMLAREAIEALPAFNAQKIQQLVPIFDEIEIQLHEVQAAEVLFPSLKDLTIKAVEASHDLIPAPGQILGIDYEKSKEVIFWVEALARTVESHCEDCVRSIDSQHVVISQLKNLAATARNMALAMDFAFLLDPDRKLLSIGYDFANNRLDPSCYDLLASEARLASLFAIAKGDVPTKHWFRLGRTATPLGKGSALISWSGSMFEYLMPSLVMRAPVGSLLEQTNRLIVARQEAYGLSLGIPWGVSESAYNARDIEFTYQYSNFGVPGLGLKRGLSENIVISPYATGLATMIDPGAAQKNYELLASMGAVGEYGFYEALDFTKSRVPENEKVAIVQS